MLALGIWLGLSAIQASRVEYMDSFPLLELRDIYFAYPAGCKPVLDGAGLRLCTGERLGLIGANGSGKTTLFHIAMGLLKPAQGEVRFEGRPVAAAREFRALRQSVGLVFQNADDQLFCPTVLEDVAFGPLNLGKSPDQARAMAQAALARLGLAGFEKRVTHTLSGGEKKLVSLATVLAMAPRAILLDEPTNDLDPETRERLIEVLNRLDLAYCIISHDWDFLSHTISDLYSVEQGRVVLKDKEALHMHHHGHRGGDAPHVHGDLG